MNSNVITPKPVSLRYLMSVCIGTLVLVGALNLFMTMYVLPHFEGFLDVYIAARNGGRSYFMHADWFMTFSSIFITAVIAATVIVAILARRHRQGATVLTIATIIFSGVYIVTFMSNALYQLWGAWSAWLAAIVLITGAVVAEFPLILSVADPRSRFVKK